MSAVAMPLPFSGRLRVTHEQHGRVRVIAFDGELDMLTVPRLARTIHDDGSFDAIVLDLTRVSFMSHTSARLIASLCRRLGRRGTGLALAGVQNQVAQVLKLSGMAGALPLTPDVAAAIDLLS